MTSRPPLIRLTVAAEFPRADAAMRAHRLDLRSKLSGDLEGVALVCFDARYASVRWRGADRLERRHAPAAMWKALEPVLRSLAIGEAAPAELEAFVAQERQLMARCSNVHALRAGPPTIAAELDALLMGASDAEALP